MLRSVEVWRSGQLAPEDAPIPKISAHPLAGLLRFARLELVSDRAEHRRAMSEATAVGRLGAGLLVIARGKLSRQKGCASRAFP